MTAFNQEVLSAILGFILLLDIIAAVAITVVAIIHFRKGRK